MAAAEITELAAFRDTARRLLHDGHDAMRDVVDDLSVEDLDWRPIHGANSIGVLVTHALDAERFLVAAAADVVLERDREAAFRVEGSSSDDLAAFIDRMEAEIDDYLDRVRPDLLGATLTRGSRVHPGAWWILHPLEHSREHIGQALLTRQLLEAGTALGE
ncbi:MAG TPA: DinB family protein [Candidatus Limnocylindrales bacterium]